ATLSSTSPLLTMIHEFMRTSGAVVSLTGGSTLTTNVGLLNVTTTVISADQLVSIRDGATLISPTSVPVVQLTDSSLVATGSVFDLRGSATTTETDPDAASLPVGTDTPVQA